MHLITDGSFTTNFDIRKPNKLYDIDEHKYLPWHQQAIIYTDVYKLELTEDEKNDLTNHITYMRFMCYQDSPTSRAYMRAYCRPMSEMIPEHYDAAQIVPDDMCIGEINIQTGHFFGFLLQ
jgi:hypothetical protein